MRKIRFAPLWLFIGWIYAGVIVYLSLAPIHPGLDFPQSDKFAHVVVYFFLMFWFMQLYETKRSRWTHVGVFLLLGAGLEILQGMGGVRQAEWLDMAANTSGVALGYQVGKRLTVLLP